MSSLPYSGRLTAQHCPVHLQRQISPIIPTVFRIVQRGMFALCSCLYDSTGTVECHVERDGVLGEGSKGTVEYNIGSVVLGNKGISPTLPEVKNPRNLKYQPLYHNAPPPPSALDRVKIDLLKPILLIFQDHPIEIVNFLLLPIVWIFDPEQRAGRSLYFGGVPLFAPL
jgi:hypothetical protein